MKPNEIRELLQQTLDDRRLSRGERRALGAVLEELEPSPQWLALIRSIAFDLAAESMTGADSRSVVEWLEELVKLLDRQRADVDEPVVAESHFSRDLLANRLIDTLERLVAGKTELNRLAPSPPAATAVASRDAVSAVRNLP